MKTAIWGFILCLFLATPAWAEKVVSKTVPMSFEGCLETIRRTASQFGMAPVNIVETTDVRMVRFRTDDGSVLITCSRQDRKMVLTQSPYYSRK